MVEKKPTYIFGNVLGNLMSKLDLRVQLEASMMSMTLILIGLVLSTFYMTFYVQFPLWYKITLIVNLLAAFVFLTSNLITTYQQYQNYMQVIEFNKNIQEVEDEKITTANTNTNL